MDEHTKRSDFVLGFKGARDSILCYISKTNTASEQHILTSNKSKLHSRHDFFCIYQNPFIIVAGEPGQPFVPLQSDG